MAGNAEPSSFALTNDPIDSATLARGLTEEAAGALVTFEGRVRNSNEGRAVVGLEYEAYEELARREGDEVIAEASRRFPIIRASCIHRVGTLSVGDLAVWVGVVAGHRAEAFNACRFIIDEVKARVPIWKKEHYAEGESAWLEGSETERETRT